MTSEAQTEATTTVVLPDAHAVRRVSLLLIEDNPLDARLVEEELAEPGRSSFAIVWVQTLAAGLKRLAEDHIDLVLLDLTLPDSGGLETFERVHAQAPSVPVIVMSGLSDEALAVKALQAGAQDYLVKGLADGGLLTRAIRYGIERQRIELALERERDLLNALLDNIPDHIYFKDAQSRFTRLSRSVARQFGFTDPQAALGKTDFDVFTAEHAQPAFDDEQRVMRTGQPLVGKVEKETMPDGAVTWALTTKMPLRDKYGRVIGTFGISKDVTELKLMEEELTAERNLLRSLIDGLPDHIYVKDAHHRFIVCNQALAGFFGLKSPEEIAGKWDFDFFPESTARWFLEEERALERSGQPRLNREAEVTDHQHKAHWISSTKVAMRDGQGRFVGIVGINRDITERKLAEEKLNQLNADLAQSQVELLATYESLKKSTEELQAAQMQLIQAAKMESVGRLAAGVAHEVKNPLAILLMGVEYLAEALPGAADDVRMTLGQMTEAVRRADGIVRGMLDFSVSSDLVMKENGLNAALEQGLLLVSHELRERRIEVVRRLATDLPGLRMDRPKIEQVFINLFLNAIQAMPEGGRLIVTTTREPGQVVATVEDTGPGIASEMLSRVFDPFFTTKATGKGTGLGLSVSRKIIELHGGKLELANRAEGGVRATITFNI